VGYPRGCPVAVPGCAFHGRGGADFWWGRATGGRSSARARSRSWARAGPRRDRVKREQMARIGFIGLGNMGLPMSLNLRKVGHSVAGFDVSAAAVEKLVAGGGTAADAIKAAASNVDAVISMLPSGSEVREVYLKAGI